jgi:hypothetical protein
MEQQIAHVNFLLRCHSTRGYGGAASAYTLDGGSVNFCTAAAGLVVG